VRASMRIAVAGATGRVGSRVVEVLEAGGDDVVPLSRSTGVDVVTGEGLAGALAGAECVIDAASGTASGRQRRDPKAASEFFTASARNLHEFGHKAGVQRMVEVSVLGIDHFTAGQGAAKYGHEKAMLAGPIPVRMLRAALFHEMVPPLIEWGTEGDVAYVRNQRIQPVAARAVAQALVDLATDPAWAASPARSEPPFPEIAGPRRAWSTSPSCSWPAAAPHCGFKVSPTPATPTTRSGWTAACWPTGTPPSLVRRSRRGLTPTTPTQRPTGPANRRRRQCHG
jgi:uncharacterized protein YbjT (DUF2867 family)